MGHTSRRRLLWGGCALAGSSLLVGCGLALPPWRSPAAVPRLGIISGASATFYVPLLAAFRQGLRDHGYEEGRSIAIEERYLDGRNEQAPEVVDEVLRLGVATLVTGSPAVVQAAQRATTTVPIIMAGAGSDPVSTGLVTSLARPGGNTTGLSLGTPQLPERRLQVLRDTVPTTGGLGVLLDDNIGLATISALEQQLTEAGRSIGVGLHIVHVQSADELEPAFLAMSQAGVGAVLVPATPLSGAHIDKILDLVLRYRLPAMISLPDIARDRGLMALGVDQADIYRRAAGYVDKVLKGADPGELPIELPAKFDFVINLRTAQALGLTIPQVVLLQATEVVQ